MKRSKKVGLVASLALVAVIVASLLVGVRSVSASCNEEIACWNIVSSYSTGIGDSLNGVVAISSKDVWAVGNYVNSSSVAQTLIEKYDGASWSHVSSPNVGSGSNYLNGVGFATADQLATDVWAVGYYTTTSVTDTLIEQYHSGSLSTVSSPNPLSSSNVLNSVAGNKASNYWAVGYYYNTTDARNETLIEQWNGSSWSTVSSTPNPGSGTRNDYLTSVTAVDSTHAWAGGYYTDGSGSHPLALKYISGSWQDDTTQLPSTSGQLAGISFIGASDGWAMGDNGGNTLDFRYTGSWANGTLSDNTITSVDYIGSSSAWVVGYNHATFPRSVTDYWDGSSWTHYALEGSGASFGDQLYAVNGVSNTDTWAVGIGVNCCSYQLTTFIEHYN